MNIHDISTRKRGRLKKAAAFDPGGRGSLEFLDSDMGSVPDRTSGKCLDPGIQEVGLGPREWYVCRGGGT